MITFKTSILVDPALARLPGYRLLQRQTLKLYDLSGLPLPAVHEIRKRLIDKDHPGVFLVAHEMIDGLPQVADFLLCFSLESSELYTVEYLDRRRIGGAQTRWITAQIKVGRAVTLQCHPRTDADLVMSVTIVGSDLAP